MRSRSVFPPRESDRRPRHRADVLPRVWVALAAGAALWISAGNSLASAQETAVADPPADETSGDAVDATGGPDAPQPLDQPKTEVDPGQADLDEAVLKRIDADTGSKLEAVARLLESALAKGLGDENTEFAKQMLGSVQLQLGQGLFGAMMRGAGGDVGALRRKATEYLQKAVENDDQLVEAYVLIAQLNSPSLFPDADADLALDSINKAIELYEDDAKKRSGMLAMRAGFQEDPEQQLADLDKAIEIDPSNSVALDARVVLLFNDDKIDQAVEFYKQRLGDDPLNITVVAVATDKLMDADRDQEAIDLLTEILEKQSDTDLQEKIYRMRSRVHSKLQNQEAAIADLNKSWELRPGDPRKLIELSQRSLENEDLVAAKKYLNEAINLEPRIEQLPETILVEFWIASEEKRIPDAINAVEQLIKMQEGDEARQAIWREQLGRLYLVDDRPRQAIEVFDEILATQPENESVLRSRGDALLAIGRHADAIRDYEDALALLEASETGPASELQSTDVPAAEYAGILNNLAWVLATSPQDGVRDGRRSLELSLQAARLTDYNAAHILSTLAASYGELGDLQKAIEYSRRAIDLGEVEGNEQLDQLKLELESYREGQPWREKQDTEENQKPILSPEDLIDI